jgi:hypothetical protein
VSFCFAKFGSKVRNPVTGSGTFRLTRGNEGGRPRLELLLGRPRFFLSASTHPSPLPSRTQRAHGRAASHATWEDLQFTQALWT